MIASDDGEIFVHVDPVPVTLPSGRRVYSVRLWPELATSTEPLDDEDAEALAWQWTCLHGHRWAWSARACGFRALRLLEQIVEPDADPRVERILRSLPGWIEQQPPTPPAGS